jgi:hypothetical protein
MGVRVPVAGADKGFEDLEITGIGRSNRLRRREWTGGLFVFC